jgi:hypothetical protein
VVEEYDASQEKIQYIFVFDTVSGTERRFKINCERKNIPPGSVPLRQWKKI